jgi:hypothetical protein
LFDGRDSDSPENANTILKKEHIVRTTEYNTEIHPSEDANEREE